MRNLSCDGQYFHFLKKTLISRVGVREATTGATTSVRARQRRRQELLDALFLAKPRALTPAHSGTILVR